MFNIEFYEDKNGFSELNDELMELAKKLKLKKQLKNVMIIKFEMEENNYENMGRFQKGC